MKLSSLLLAGALLVTSASPALAIVMPMPWVMPQMGATVKNVAFVSSTANAVSTTGGNLIDTCNTCGPQLAMPSMFGWPAPAPVTTNYISSGTAYSEAGSQVGGVNYTGNVVGLKSVSNFAKINSLADAVSGTGMNMILGSGANNSILSGAAGSLSTSIVTNVNVTGLGLAN